MRQFSKVIATALLVGVALTGCRVHTIDLPQGTPLTQTKARQVQVGMTQNQVLYILGSPALRDTLAPTRWDYIYDYTAGTEGKRAKKADVKNASQYLSVYFDTAGRVSKVEGLGTLPK